MNVTARFPTNLIEATSDKAACATFSRASESTCSNLAQPFPFGNTITSADLPHRNTLVATSASDAPPHLLGETGHKAEIALALTSWGGSRSPSSASGGSALGHALLRCVWEHVNQSFAFVIQFH